MSGGWRLLFLSIVSLVLVSGCISLCGQGGEEGVEDIVDSINEDPSTYYRVEEIVELGEEAVPDLIDMLEDEDRHKRAAATYALSRIVFEIDEGRRGRVLAHMRKSFSDTDSSVSATAAGVAVASGDKSGIPYLIRQLGSDEDLLLIDPPEPVAAYSVRVLREYTGQDFGFDASAPLNGRAQAIQEWVSWWSQNKDALSWDPGMGEYGGYR